MRNASRRSQSPYLLGSLSKGLEVMDCFARQSSWSLAELANTLQQSKPTLFRILHTLEAFGYLQKDSVSGRYSLGMRLCNLGSVVIGDQQLHWQSLPPLQELARQTGETVHVGILYEGRVTCVQAVDGPQMVRTESALGKRAPAYASAMGKMLLAYLPDDELDTLFAGRTLTRFSPKTITDLATLRLALRRARLQGWVLDDEEMELGLRCIAAPILNGANRPWASAAISAPAIRLEPARVQQLLPPLQTAVQRIGQMLGGPTLHRAATSAA